MGIPYRAIADSTYDWETWVDEHDRVRWVNPAVERLTGYRPEECLAMPEYPLALVQAADRARVAEVLRSAREGRAGNDVEFRVVRKDGALRWVAISWQPLSVGDGAVRGYRTSVRDIQERKLAEERLRDAERRASRAASERFELLATLSHELRSPLHCIAGFAELLGRAPLDAEPAHWVQIVSDQSEALLRLVEDLLQYVASSEGPPVLRRAPFDLPRLVEGEANAMRPRLAAGVALGVAIDDGARGEFEGDVEQVRRVLANLLSNAARFTRRGRIDVVVALEGNDVVLEVRDTGIGMSEAELARVREPFVQGASSASSRGGVGLGLAIVDRLLEAMGGTLTLESGAGTGTRAVVRCPLARPSRPSAAAALASSALEGPGEASALRVLVVDDLEPARELLAAMFRTLGVEVDAAPDGRTALERSRRARYDLVLLDYHMPELDGLETARLLRAEAAGAEQRPVFALLTANTLVGAREDPLAAGVDVVLTKPLRLEHLRRLAQRALGGAPVIDEARTSRARVTDEIDLEVVGDLLAVRDARGVTLLARSLHRVDACVVRLGERLRCALAEGALDAPALAAEVHAVKGLVASVGARGASARASALESAIAQGRELGSIAPLVDALDRDWSAARAELGACAEEANVSAESARRGRDSAPS